MNPEYKPVSIFGHPFKIDGRQIYHHAGRDRYSIEYDHQVLVALNNSQWEMLHNTLAWEKAELDAADAHDDDGKTANTELW